MLIHTGGDKYVNSDDVICILDAALVKGSAAGFIASLREQGQLENESPDTASYVVTHTGGETRAYASEITVRTLEKRSGLYSAIWRK